ncbi:efflux RND transporter periplasmic adaptor subunit [Alteriqipengyuania flavescens]|uniref:efflux RND transporter periplasmic adaptor subunit n=1 Tax=Alteriqipengyuania flavescens TaxID=3053610 RepID=UPI0025B441BB|nr:efflux RND transporter periplasmic adaptor subunit [Alteriqipengyuania flavescens]WJY17543.1 efflux RND transporter periplasmic adaptor subunit [Alteriqipengyuania flavescens]WJY23486.1 efflux RND transporter periplasmic adaptor subunit [Alteriqipengyuania flavescens]
MTLRNLSFSRQILPAIAVLGLILAAIYIATGLPDRELAPAEEEPARATGELADAPRVAGAGVVEPSSETIDIGTAVSGLVTDIRATPGDYVQRGQPLFTVDDRAIRARIGETGAAIGEAQAAIAEARSAEATAAQQLALYRGVSDPAAVSRSEVIRAEGEASAARERRQLAEARLSAARARLQSAQALQQSARTELGRLTVRAPISGEILAVNIRPGEFVSAGGPQGGNTTPFIQMGETRPLYVRIDIDEDEAVRIDMGAPAFVSPRGAADRQVRAQFVRAEPLVVPKRSLTNSAAERVDVRVMQVLYQLPPVDIFRVGQQVDAFIPARGREAAQGGANVRPAPVEAR